MNADVLLILYVAIISAVMVVLLGWFIWMFVDQVRQGAAKKAEKNSADTDTLAALVKLLEAKNEEAKTVAPAPVVEEPVEEPVAPAPVVAEPVEEPVEEAVAEEEEDGNSVVLVRSASVTYAEAYSTLSAKDKGYADEILAYAKAKAEAKEVVNDRAATVYLGKKQIVRLFIRKGVVIAKLIMPNNTLNAYADNNALNIKEKPIDIKITKPELVGSVKDIIDLVYDALIVDRNRREEEKKERRRQARLAKKAQENK